MIQTLIWKCYEIPENFRERGGAHLFGGSSCCVLQTLWRGKVFWNYTKSLTSVQLKQQSQQLYHAMYKCLVTTTTAVKFAKCYNTELNFNCPQNKMQLAGLQGALATNQLEPIRTCQADIQNQCCPLTLQASNYSKLSITVLWLMPKASKFKRIFL